MMNQTTPFALITGASRGIGKEYARVLAASGYDLLLIGRDTQKLETLRQELHQTSQSEVWVESLDLSQPQAAETLHNVAQSYRTEVSLLINNAGFGMYGDFSEMRLTNIRNMLQLHINTIVESIRLFLPNMLTRKHGAIITVASVAGFFPIPYITEYAATKAFLIAFSEGLARETQNQGVTIQVCCPGFTETDFHQSAGHQPKHVLFTQSPQQVVPDIITGSIIKTHRRNNWLARSPISVGQQNHSSQNHDGARRKIRKTTFLQLNTTSHYDQ